jgi:hypothetical protein
VDWESSHLLFGSAYWKRQPCLRNISTCTTISNSGNRK